MQLPLAPQWEASSGTNGPGGRPHRPSTHTVMLDDFSIRRQLGKGGSGTVLLVQDILTHRQLALKVIRKCDLNEDSARVCAMEKQIHISVNADGGQHFLPLLASWQDRDHVYFLTVSFISLSIQPAFVQNIGQA